MSVKIKKQCIVLLSGGLDSATVLNIALENYDVTALIFDYGQRHKFEISAAKKIAEIADIPIKLITIDLGQFGNSALTDNIEVPKNQDIGKEIPITYVPVRNTIFLSYALAYAEVNNIFDIFIGVNALDYSGYPDCRPEFIEAFEKMANEGTKFAQGDEKINIHTPLINLNPGGHGSNAGCSGSTGVVIGGVGAVPPLSSTLPLPISGNCVWSN